MSTVSEVENALREMTLEDARSVAAWLQEYLDEQWDQQIDADATSGKLDNLWRKAEADITAGRVKPLNEVIDDQ